MGAAASVSDGSFKGRGDDCFRVGQHQEAIYWYTKALVEETSFDRIVEAAINSNRAAAYEAIGQHESALIDSLQAAKLRPDWPKGHYRAAKACKALGRSAEALYHLSTALALAPGDEVLLEVRFPIVLWIS
jgi:translocation protein SEC72